MHSWNYQLSSVPRCRLFSCCSISPRRRTCDRRNVDFFYTSVHSVRIRVSIWQRRRRDGGFFPRLLLLFNFLCGKTFLGFYYGDHRVFTTPFLQRQQRVESIRKTSFPRRIYHLGRKCMFARFGAGFRAQTDTKKRFKKRNRLQAPSSRRCYSRTNDPYQSIFRNKKYVEKDRKRDTKISPLEVLWRQRQRERLTRGSCEARPRRRRFIVAARRSLFSPENEVIKRVFDRCICFLMRPVS